MAVGSAKKLRLLMWKNFLLQWRHKLQTVMEIFAPVLCASLIVLVRSLVDPVMVDTVHFDSFNPLSLRYSIQSVLPVFSEPPISLAYSPDSPLAESVARNALRRVILTNLPLLEEFNVTTSLPVDNLEPFIDLFLTVLPFANSSQLDSLYMDEANLNTVIAAVQFSDDLAGQTTWPDNVSYALRFPTRKRVFSTSWRTNMLFPRYPTPGPRTHNESGGNDPGYAPEMFLALQHAISLELIIAKSNNPDIVEAMNVTMQRFPHPPYLEDDILQVLESFVSLFLMLSFTYTAVNVVRAITTEKERQLKESMKIMGLRTWLHWVAWFLKQFIFMLISVLIILILLKVEWYTTEDGLRGYSVFTNTHWTVLLVFLVLYVISAICFCFMLSVFFDKASTAGLVTAVLWFLSYAPYFFLQMDTESLSLTTAMLACLSFNTAMGFGFQQIVNGEGQTTGMQWSMFFSSDTGETSFVFGYTLIMMAVSSIVYIVIMLYVEKAFPGAYGVPVPWYFPFTKEFWGFSSKEVSYVDQNESNSWDIIYDKEPVGLNTGVNIVNLTKIYNSTQKAVDHLNLQMYEDQITVLLGHNGAGKTTTLSMLTGMIPPTTGTAIISGHDIVNDTHEARASLGLCPQHSILFDELTVAEHIEFYGQLKGITKTEVKQEIDHYVNILELSHKRNYQASMLSGGQQRRLCVGVAMCGNSKVVLLDEPTSGMDPAARRALWDLLQREKKGRTILLTTHFMDEADILGDRIAIMSGGRLQCIGSPFFLKKQYGLGYTLTIVKEPHCNVRACTALLSKFLPGTDVYTNIGTELSYQLPNEGSSHFEQMLGDIEAHQRELGIQSFGLTMTALEEVFMKVGADLHVNKKQSYDNLTANGTSDTAESVIGSTSTDSIYNTDYRKTTGWRLTYNHIIAMLLKKALTSLRARLQLILQILIPVIILIVSILVNIYNESLTEMVVNRVFNLEVYQQTSTLFSNHVQETDLEWPIQNAYRRNFEQANDPTMLLDDIGGVQVDEYYLSKGDISMSQLRFENLIGASFDSNQMTAWFSNFAFHDITTSLATLHLAMLQSLVPTATMSISNYPLPVPPDGEVTFESTEGMNAIRIAFNIGSAMAIVSSFFVMFYINERISRAKLMQKVSGLQPIVMWTCALIYDMLVYLVICVLLIITLLAFSVEGYSMASEIGYLLLILIPFGFAMLTLHYLTIYAFESATSGFVRMYFISLFLGCMAFLIVEVLNIPSLGRQDVGQAMDEVLIFYPHYALTQALRNMNFISLNIANCETLCEVLPSQTTECNLSTLCASNFTSCCINDNVYFEWRSPGISRYITYMALTAVVFFAILMIIEYRLIDKIFYSASKQPLPLDLDREDSDVVSEKLLVDKIATEDLENYNVVCSNLSKFYQKHLAVNQTSFAIKGAECFGLLGINGAGKTTTFKMLTGDLSMSYGDAWIKGNSIKNQIKEVHREIGYCPQFDALFNQLTGRETLKIFGLLRGIPSDTGKYISDKLAHKLGFTKHLDKKVGEYSGGNKRKLSTAVALLGDAPVIYLDEPTTGMDPAAKRQLWEVILVEVRNGRSVILTSHSMEECEALCSRLAIMVDGRFRCLGSPQHLKNKFSQGCTLTLKVSQVDVGNATHVGTEWILNSALQPIHNFIKENYPNAQLVEYYQSLLTYYLPNNNLSWSSLFGAMERAKQIFNIEDYSLSQTTLEQVFLRFTKETPVVTTEL